MQVSAKITEIKYSPLLCKKLETFDFKSLKVALSKNSSFILKIDENKHIAVSWWVSAKRTRSYPYARVYNTLYFQGKKIAIIPVFKDEGKQGDRDFLQWDTISLMSLLGVYVIISYYVDAKRSVRYDNKITKQRFDIPQINAEIFNLLSYQSDALHWNLSQADKICHIGQNALDAYVSISERIGVQMHSEEQARKRISEISEGKERFISLSRNLARQAQSRESKTVQSKENLVGQKASINIKNYLGGYYYFTSDEVVVDKNKIYLIEGKHSKKGIPTADDIKDGLIKMILFANLKKVKIAEKEYVPIPVLKLTTEKNTYNEMFAATASQLKLLKLLKKESTQNNFQVMINDVNLQNIELE
ncbi:MAG: hypothetical protein WDA18_07215 [Candidatus Ratteibacteria bacterium]